MGVWRRQLCLSGAAERDLEGNKSQISSLARRAPMHACHGYGEKALRRFPGPLEKQCGNAGSAGDAPRAGTKGEVGCPRLHPTEGECDGQTVLTRPGPGGGFFLLAFPQGVTWMGHWMRRRKGRSLTTRQPFCYGALTTRGRRAGGCRGWLFLFSIYKSRFFANV